MSAASRTCAVIPTFNNPLTIAGVVADVRRHLDDVLIVDDGSHDEAPARAGRARAARASRA